MNPCAHELSTVLDSYKTTIVLLIIKSGKCFVGDKGKRTKQKCCSNIPDAGVKNITYNTKNANNTRHDCVQNSKSHI
jgi:hypothetical protein